MIPQINEIKSDNFFTKKSGLPGHNVTVLAQKDSNLLFASVEQNGLLVLPLDAEGLPIRLGLTTLSLQSFTTANSNLPSDNVLDLKINDAGILWILTPQAIAFVNTSTWDTALPNPENGNIFTLLTSTDELWSGPLKSIDLNGSGGLWVASGSDFQPGGINNLAFAQGYNSNPEATTYNASNGFDASYAQKIVHSPGDTFLYFFSADTLGRIGPN